MTTASIYSLADEVKYYIYRYVDPIKNDVFYIGKGKDYREREHLYVARMDKKYHRNSHLTNRIKSIWKAGLEPIIERLWEGNDEKLAYEKEKEFVSLYGRKDKKMGTLCNHSNGGVGYNLTPEQEARRKPKAIEASKKAPWTDERKERFSKAMKQRFIDDPTLAMRATAHLRNRTQTKEEKDKRNKALEGKRYIPTIDEREALSKRMTENNPMSNPSTVEKMRQSNIGKVASEETKRKMSEIRKGKKFKIVQCPHCEKEGGESGMKSWHFDNCYKINNNRRAI